MRQMYHVPLFEGTYPMNSGKLWVALIIFGVMSVIFIRGTIFLYGNGNNGFRLRRRGVVTTAICTGIQALDGAFSLHYEYEVDGASYTGSSSAITTTSITPGEDIAVTYDPRRPSQSDATECVGKHRILFLALLALLAPATVALCVFELLLIEVMLFD
jgi:hypothetical protein